MVDELDTHQCEFQLLGETEDFQIPLVVEDIDGMFREIVRTHDNIETESEDNSTVSLLCEICDELRPSDKHCISNLFNTASYYTSLLKPKICLRWVSREKSVKPVKR